MKTNETTPIPQGYKATPLGIIPQEWEIYDFDRIVIRSQSHYLPNPQIHLRCIELEHLSQGDGSILGYIDSAEQKSMKNEFEEGDVLFGKLRPYLRKYWLAKFRGVCSTEIWVLRAISDVCTKEYLFDIISSYNFVQKANVSSGSKMPRAEWDYVSKIPILTPPLAEQRKIAEVLGVWDKAIEKQSQLIEQLTLRKRGLMQQLLTAKRRLPGFSGRWEDVELGEILIYEQPTPYIVRDTNYQNGYKTPVLTAGKTFILGYTNEDCGICNNIPVILFDDFTTDSRYIDFEFKVKSSATKLLRVKGNDSLYFIYCALQCLKYVVGGHERHWISKFQYLTISLPSVEEQTAIVQVLTAADREIELAQQKLELLRQQKRGLMQQLLTGKKRVKI